ncbi:hypothetical protein B0H13DRAFT_2262973 [Mycena leptocephala]|nr:hypothetical protein B0H13DRAFT_2262973 [Mycena leptocephala]
MQYFERFDVRWEAMMQDFLQMAMAGSITQAIVQARFVQQTVHSLVLNEHGTRSNFPLYRCYVIWGFQKKIVIVPALLMLSTFVLGIIESAAAKFSIRDLQITLSLAAATNLVLTALSGKLESGAIYCITAIVLVITSSLDLEIYAIELSVVQHGINIIPTFTLVYIGLNNTDYKPKEHIHQVASTHHASSRSAVVRPCEPREVLDIKPQSTEEKDREGV